MMNVQQQTKQKKHRKLQRFYLFLGITAFVFVVYFSSMKSSATHDKQLKQHSKPGRQQQELTQTVDENTSLRLRRPNLVFILTDDQDVVLDGFQYMPGTSRLLVQRGANLVNSFVASPLCCPSRSSILTGRYVHNHGGRNNSVSGGCSSLSWQNGPEKDTFAVHLQSAGYRTFFAGKYLNQYGEPKVGGVSHVPPGWDHWIGLVGNSRYYNYSLSVNGLLETHGDDPEKDYLTKVIWDRAIEFLNGVGGSKEVEVEVEVERKVDKRSVQSVVVNGVNSIEDERPVKVEPKEDQNILEALQQHQQEKENINDDLPEQKNQEQEQQPFFMMLSTPASHAPFTPLPKYSQNFTSIKAPRTKNFNIKNDDSKHWLLRLGKQPLSNEVIDRVDEVFRNRLRTLLTVDDMIVDIVTTLERKSLLDNTYIIFTSDNGYHLGQFSQPLDKREPYEFDIRVPLIVRGPGVEEGSTISQLVVNIDLAPTFLDLANIDASKYMDGISFKSIIVSESGMRDGEVLQGDSQEYKVSDSNSSETENISFIKLLNKNVKSSNNTSMVKNSYTISTSQNTSVMSKVQSNKKVSVQKIIEDTPQNSPSNSTINKSQMSPRRSKSFQKRNILIEHFGEGHPQQNNSCDYIGANLYGCAPDFDCKCSDSTNNTFACIRRYLSPDSDTVFCLWDDDTAFLEYYDLSVDKAQLYNKVDELSNQQIMSYLKALEKLIKCRGELCHDL